ncbi:hypothetical protein QF030_007860 [Streptomyces rishiriensis]|uniref:Secreted protein n=1 Tax=Streptomyces rishiriensis TaxID=68264 RepID=A0ABU0P2Q3_STRRH|nr:hypothetical protein [Streptomyces rishiriensis]
MAPDGYSDAVDRAGEGGGDRPDSSPDPHRPGPADSFWVGMLVLIAVVLLLTVLVAHMDWSPGDPTNNMPPYK